MIRFILVYATRTGSNYLMSLLGQHENVEVFWAIFHSDRKNRDGVYGQVYEDGADALAFLDQVFERPYAVGKKAVGFKLMYEHGASGKAKAVWDRIIDDSSIRIIHLVRENYLEMLVSLEVAAKSGVWSIPRKLEAERRVEVPPFELSVQRCADYFDSISKQRAHIERIFSGHQKILVRYGELISACRTTFDRVCDFLSISHFMPEERTVKIAQKPVAQQLGNFEELKAAFSGTQYYDFFAGQS